MLISTDGPTKLIFNSQVLLNLVRKYSTGNSLLDTWLTFYEKAKNNNASIIIHVLNICREWEIEKKITKLSCKQFSLKVSQSAACVDTSRWPTCTLCHWPLVPYTSTTLITPTPVPSVYSCPFNSLTPTSPQPITPRYSWDPPGFILVCRGWDTSLDSSVDVNCLTSSVISENVGRSEGTSVQHFNISR